MRLGLLKESNPFENYNRGIGGVNSFNHPIIVSVLESGSFCRGLLGGEAVGF